MAKQKQTIGDSVFAKTTKPKKEVKQKPVSIGLSVEEVTRLEEIAKELGQSRHAVMKYAVVDFVRRYDAGERPKTKKITVTKEVFDLD